MIYFMMMGCSLVVQTQVTTLPVDACRAYCLFLLTNRTFLCHYITAVPLITAVSSKMSASPSQLCLLRNYNYGGGELPDSFTIDPNKARQRLGLEIDGELETLVAPELQKTVAPIKCAPRTGKGSRYPGKYTTVSVRLKLCDNSKHNILTEQARFELPRR